jgi:hypothetical protein
MRWIEKGPSDDGFPESWDMPEYAKTVWQLVVDVDDNVRDFDPDDPDKIISVNEKDVPVGGISRHKGKWMASTGLSSSYKEEGEFSPHESREDCKIFTSLKKAKRWMEEKYKQKTNWGSIFIE